MRRGRGSTRRRPGRTGQQKSERPGPDVHRGRVGRVHRRSPCRRVRLIEDTATAPTCSHRVGPSGVPSRDLAVTVCPGLPSTACVLAVTACRVARFGVTVQTGRILDEPTLGKHARRSQGNRKSGATFHKITGSGQNEHLDYRADSCAAVVGWFRTCGRSTTRCRAAGGGLLAVAAGAGSASSAGLYRARSRYKSGTFRVRNGHERMRGNESCCCWSEVVATP
jgi:hypothetical protein